jgi:hypothetical protein
MIGGVYVVREEQLQYRDNEGVSMPVSPRIHRTVSIKNKSKNVLAHSPKKRFFYKVIFIMSQIASFYISY